MQTKAPKTITKTTLKLLPGDEILTGNMFDGFDSYKIINVIPSEFSNRQAIVTIQFPHDGIVKVIHGKNTRWSVIA